MMLMRLVGGRGVGDARGGGGMGRCGGRWGGERFDGFFAEGDQPVPAVGVRERDSVAHFLFIGGWVEIVTFEVGNGALCGEVSSYGGFAAACGTSDDPDVLDIFGADGGGESGWCTGGGGHTGRV